MKRRALIRQIKEKGCVFIRPGGKHDWYQNPNTGACQPVPRHVETNEHLARHIEALTEPLVATAAGGRREGFCKSLYD